MPNFYEEQARQRLQRAKAFVDKAHGLMLQEDLVSRSALDDAVSAVKNSLQGYLMYQIATLPGGAGQRDWPEVAASNRMPDLIRACQQAGLPLSGLDVEIRKLNDERNFRTHDDPLRIVDSVQARQAVEVALMVQRRIADALKRRGVSGILTATSAAGSDVATLPKTGAGRAPVAARATQQTSQAAVLARSTASAAANAVSDTALATNGQAPLALGDEIAGDEDDEVGNTTRVAEQAWARRRAIGLLTRVVASLALVVVGAMAGLAYASYSGVAAHGLAFFSSASTTSANTTPTATATLLPANASFSAGALLVSAPICQAGRNAVTLRNLGVTPLTYSIGSPDASDAVFAPGLDAQGQSTFAGTILAGATATVYAQTTAARYHIVIIGQTGTIQLPAGAC